MAFLWSKDLETGNATIDAQHKQLIEAFNNLIDACNQGKGRAEIENTLRFLSDYTITHFNDEEALQSKYKYPDFITHKRAHDSFKRVVEGLAAQLAEEGPSIVLVGKFNSSIGEWLVNHIKSEDVKIASHIQSCS